MLHVLPLPSEHSPTSTPPRWSPPPSSASSAATVSKPRTVVVVNGIRRNTHKFTRKVQEEAVDGTDSDDKAKSPACGRQRSISECYFAVKGAALVLPQNECIHLYKKSSTDGGGGGDIQQHLQSMFYLLRPEDTLKMAVKLESIHSGRMRYLVVVSCMGKQSTEESCLLGVDCNERTTIGMVLPVWADTRITLDGDGGFSVSTSERHHIFKPVSVQAMWSALQTLHKASAKAREYHYFMVGSTHSWIECYEKKIESDRSCLNEWYAMDNLESRRPPSPDCLRSRPKERAITEQDIRVKLKEIMMTVDLDEVTSKYIRTRLEEDLDIDLHEYKSFIDQEMIIILGQMDAATEIFDHLYLGSEWNASNLEELQKNGVGHILNVTREIDNFFPGMFDYLNVRVYDDEGTELLKHWDTTYKFINNAKDKGSKVLVHCKMGISRSASVVIAYAMKAHNWNMQKAMEFVKHKRTCIKPNVGFMKQLEIYQGILDASKQRHNKLWRSKSENNLNTQQQDDWQEITKNVTPTAEPQIQEALCLEVPVVANSRPKSWSPDDNVADMLFPVTAGEGAAVDGELDSKLNLPAGKHGKHVLLPCGNGKSYSVSPNKALHLALPSSNVPSEPVTFQVGGGGGDGPASPEAEEVAATKPSSSAGVPEELCPANAVPRVSSIKDRINELESQAAADQRGSAGLNRDRLDIPENKGLVLNLANQFETGSKSNPSSPVEEISAAADGGAPPPPVPFAEEEADVVGVQGNGPILSQTMPAVCRHQAVIVRPGAWIDESANGKTSSGLLLPPMDKGGGGGDCGFDSPETFLATENLPSATQVPDEVIMRLRVNSQVVPMGAKDELGLVDAADRWLDSELVPPGGLATPDDAGQASQARQNDPFSAQLDRVFEREESRDHCRKVPLRNDSWGSCDSAIVVGSPGGQRDFPSRQSSWTSTDSRSTTLLSRECSWGSADSTRRLCGGGSGGTEETWNGGGDGKCPETVDAAAERSLKRTSSFDGALPLHVTREVTGAGCEVCIGVIENVQGGVIQRSQSLRTHSSSLSTRSANNMPKAPVPPNLGLHGPKPYKSPGGWKQTFFGAVPPIQTHASSSSSTSSGSPPAKTSPLDGAVADTTVVHYASTPILYKSSSDSGVPTLHSLSQPNISTVPLTHSTSATTVPTVVAALRFRSNLKLDLFGCLSRSPPSECAPAAEVPSYGIVKQHKAVLENFIASMPPPPSTTRTVSGSPPKNGSPPPRDLPAATSSAEVWKKVQQKLQLLEKQPQRVLACTSDPVEDAPGVVKRITREMEAKGGGTTGQGDGQKMLILDQNGKEVVAGAPSAQLQTLPVAPKTGDATTFQVEESSTVAPPPSVCSPIEEKSVRSLVGKFEVKDPQQQHARQRYFSETEVSNMLPWNVAALSPPAVVCSNGGRRKQSLDSSYDRHHVCGMQHQPSSGPVLRSSSSSSVKKEALRRANGTAAATSLVTPPTRSALNCRPPPASRPTNNECKNGGRGTTPQKQHVPRKTKSQGWSHPLSKLPCCKQRSANSLYNTM